MGEGGEIVRDEIENRWFRVGRFTTIDRCTLIHPPDHPTGGVATTGERGGRKKMASNIPKEYQKSYTWDAIVFNDGATCVRIDDDDTTTRRDGQTPPPPPLARR